MAHEFSISVRDLHKKYRLFSSPSEKESLHPFRKAYHREFWALRGINVEVLRGEGVGIRARNGSGKSTLLQIIAGVLSPTSGHVTVDRRVAAILELGAGFRSGIYRAARAPERYHHGHTRSANDETHGQHSGFRRCRRIL